MNKAILLLILTFLFGCKTEIEIPIKLSDFDNEEKAIQVIGAMAVEVSSCNKSGSEMPSDDIFKLQTKIPYVFKGAKFISCEKNNFDSFAFFKVPVNIDNEKNGEIVNENTLNVSFFENKHKERSLIVGIHSKLQKAIKELIDSDIYAKVDDMSITLAIDPEGEKFTFNAIGVYLDDTPVQIGNFTNNGGKFKIRIPTYGIEQLLTENSEGTQSFTVLIKYLTSDASTSKATKKSSEKPDSEETSDSIKIIEDENKNAIFVKTVEADSKVVWSNIFQQAGQIYPPPELVLYRNKINSACGTASSNLMPFYCHIDRKVYVDLDFFNDLEKEFDASADKDFAKAYLIAHEIGRHIQNIEGTLDKVQKIKQSTKDTEGNALQIKVELQADCYVGIWAHYQQKLFSALEQSDVEKIITASKSLGDNNFKKQTETLPIPYSSVHGSSKQQVEWFARGVKDGRIQDCQTFQ